jgi:hypothetical protein
MTDAQLVRKWSMKMNNEPVAWMSEFGQFIGKVQDEICHIPLYTHPAKTLTDEEIDAVGDEVSNLIDTYAGRREFARAILRKAQEK